MYNYLSKDALLQGQAVVVLQSESRIENYKQITNQGELVECIGDVPAQWEYNPSEDVIYDLKDKPSLYHTLKNGEWQIEDFEGFRAYCNKNIDEIKSQVLEYGFDYEGHQQRCRDKDIIFMAITALLVFLVQTVLHKKIQPRWYFEDNHKLEFDLVKIVTFMLYGGTFVQSVYDTENYFKTLEVPQLIDREIFEAKRKEIHENLVKEG